MTGLSFSALTLCVDSKRYPRTMSTGERGGWHPRRIHQLGRQWLQMSGGWAGKERQVCLPWSGAGGEGEASAATWTQPLDSKLQASQETPRAGRETGVRADLGGRWLALET